MILSFKQFKEAYNPDEPRDPKGSRTGGQWTRIERGKSIKEIRTIEKNAEKLGVKLIINTDGLDEKWIGITWIENIKKQKGAGTKVMKNLCSFADRKKIEIDLNALGNHHYLVKFYKSFGFKINPQDEKDMLAGKFEKETAEWDRGNGPEQLPLSPPMWRKPK